MHIAVVHNAVTDESSPDEKDVLIQAEAVSDALKQLGHEPFLLACTLDLSAIKTQLKEIKPDSVFNLVESLDGQGRLIHLFPTLLDAMKIPYTGSCAEAIFMTSHKIMAKERMTFAGLPTPEWIGPYPQDIPPVHSQAGAWERGKAGAWERGKAGAWERGKAGAWERGKAGAWERGEQDIPSVHSQAGAWERGGAGAWERGGAEWIIKSLWEHASIGLDEDIPIRNKTAGEIMEMLKIQASRLGGACFAEVFIEGREFNLSLLDGQDGPQALPPAEIIFEGYEEGKPRIVGYRAKWDDTSYEYHHTPRRFDFPPEDSALLEELKQTALRCWQVFGLKGYVRVDFRVDSNGRPWILEINTNPCLSPDAGYPAAAAQAGYSLADVIKQVAGCR